MKGSIANIESMGLVDGPGIRTVVFFNNCHLRCKFCHNPEMWNKGELNYTTEELVERILRNKPYFKNGGGVTFSGGEPLLQSEFLIETCKLLKKENIHIALDTAGIGTGNYTEILSYVDLVLLDIKHITKEGYKEITSFDYIDKFFEFVEYLNKSNKDVWIRQVIVPGINDNTKYMDELVIFLKKYIKNIKRVDFLPYHKLGNEKYEKLQIKNPYQDKDEMDKDKCNELYEYFIKSFEK